MALPESTYDQFAISKLLKPVGDVYKPDVIAPAIPEYKLPANSSGIDLPYSYSKNKQNNNPVGASIDKLFKSGPTEKFLNSPITYNANEINAARYVTSPDYHKLGISLYGDNEERYGQNQSWGEVLSNGAVGMGKLAYNGFVDGWKGWSRMTDALVHWDWSKLHGDAESMMELDNSLKDIMNLNPIYATKEGSDTFWNRQTFGNFLQQSGFAVGAGLQMLSEQIITKAIEAGLAATGFGAVGAAGLEAAEDVRTAASVGRVARFFQKTKEFYDAAKNFKALKKLGDVWKNESILKNFAVSLGEKIPGIDIAMDIGKTYEIGKLAGLSKGQLVGDIARVGIGGLKRTLSEANFAFTEARMEAAGTFTDLYNQLQDDYYKQYGQFAKGNDLQFMQNKAMQAADKNFNFNSAILAVSNRIMFDNIFKNSKATSKILSQFGEDVGEKGLKVLGKIEGKTTTQYYTGGILSNYKQIAADFGASKARQVLAKSIMKPLLKFETTEGIQELLQEGSNEYFKDYYLDAYNSKFNPDIKASAEKSFGKAVESQLNMQGLKTFASGALTGMMIHGPTVLIGKGLGKIKEKTEDIYKTQGYTKEQKEEYYKQKKESKDELKNYYNEFNAIAKDPSKLFSESIKNFNIQKEGSSALNEAAKLGDKFAYENIRTDMLHSMVSQAVRNDTHEGLIDTIREYGKNMSKEEFEQAFVGINYSSKTKKSAQEYTNKVANAIESYVETYNKLQDKYGSIANPNRYTRGSEEYMKELFKKKTLNDMIDIMAGNEFKAADALDRSSRIFSTLAGHKTLGSSLASAFNILGSDDALQGELNTLELEINTKKEQLQTEGISKQQKEQLKKEIALKEKQYKNITKWSENKLNITNKSKIAKAQSSFKTYLQLKNEEFGKPTLINDSEVDDMFYAFNDYIKLNNKAQDHVNAINMLSNPDYFDQVYMRMVQGQEMAYLQNLTNAAIDYIKSDKYKADEHFIVQANGKYGVFTSTGIIVKITDDLEEARKIKEELDKIPKYTEDEIDELFKDLEATPEKPTEETPKESTEEPEVKPEEKPKTEIKKEQPKVFVNGKSIILVTQEVRDGKPIFSYYFEDDASKEIQQFTKENDKFIDLETGEEITLTKETPKETVKEPTEKSIDEKIAEIQAKIDALPNKGIVMEGEMMTTSQEFKDLNKQIENLKKQKETETEKAKIKISEVKEKLKKLNEKKLIVDPNDSNYYINESDSSERYARVSTLKEEYDGPKTDAADRGTIIDSLLRDFIANKIATLEELKKAYNDHKLKDQVATFNDSFLNDIYNIFKEVKDVTEKQGLELISDIPTLWGKLNDKDYAGSIDLLGINNNGDVYIIDLKTSSQNRRDASGANYKKFKDGDTIQQSAYAELLRQTTGITVKSVVIFPIQTSKKDNKYNSAIANKDESGKLTMSVTIDKTLFPEKKEQTQTPQSSETTTSISDKKTNIETEKQKITSSEFKELIRLAKFFLENPKEPTIAGSVVGKYPELFKAVTDIERGKQEELKKVYSILEADDSLKDLSSVLQDYNINKEFEFIIQIFKDNKVKVSFDGKHAGGLPKIASMDTGIINGKLSNILTINKSRFDKLSKKEKLEVIAHEFVHGLIKLKLNEKGDLKGTSFYKGLNDIFQEVKDFYYSGEKQTNKVNFDLLRKNFTQEELNDLGGKIRYIESSIEEFATLGLTDPIVSKFLKLLQGKGETKQENLWTKLSKLISNFLGISNTKFNELLNFISEELNTNINYTDKINAKYDAELKELEQSFPAGSVVGGEVEAKKADIEKRKKQSLSETEWSTGPARGLYLQQEPDGRWTSAYFKPSTTGVDAENIYGNTKEEVIAELEKRYNIELAALEGTTQPNIVTVYHHTTVAPKDFNFGSFQRGSESISQFGDGLFASTENSEYLRIRYGKNKDKQPIVGELNDSDFITIDANKTEKETYEELVAKGYKFNHPQMGSATKEGGKYVGGSAKSEYDSDGKLSDNGSGPLFNDFQQSNPEIKGVKVINHIIGGQKADPFYVIYDAKSFYGPGSLSKIALETEQNGVEDIDQTFNDKKDKIDGDSKEFEKIFQDGIKQTAPALSVANRTHAVNVVEISPGVERFERGDVNQTYEFEMATPTFMPGQSIIFKVDEFDDKDYDNANIGIYSVLNGKETRIGAVHTPQWISEQKGSNNAYTHIVIPDSEKYDKLPKTLENELATNRKLRKVILDNYKLDSNFALNGTVNDKSNGIIATMNETGLLKDRINPEIGKGGIENRHGMFGIVRNGYIELSRGQKINENNLAQTKSFSSSEVANYEGYAVLLIPSPNGTFFPTFIKLPTVAREQSEFILKAWKVFTERESGNDLINAVYNATGSTYVEGSKPNINILKSYINHYITNLSNKSLSQLGNGEDATDNVSRIDIFDDGNIKLQGKKNGKWVSVTIRKEEDIPSDVLDYMDGLLTSVRFTDNKNDNLLGINNEDKFTLFGVKDDKLTSNNITYNQYIMNGAKTYLEKGIESKNEYKDWVYFANPVVKFQYSEPSKDSFKNTAESKPEVTLTEVTDDTKKDKASSLLAALKAARLNTSQIKDQENNCSSN